MTAWTPDPGSFRDPSGQVVLHGGRVFRTLGERAATDYEFVRKTGLVGELQEEGWLIGSEERPLAALPGLPPGVRYAIEHPVVPFISYPYEWTFAALKAAALFHLDLQRRALARGVALSDASAYNVQFMGPRPVFIDLLSLRPYREGVPWMGHRQFCAQFLNPLLLAADVGVPFNAWYRGSLEGIAAADLDACLPWWRKLSPRALLHVHLPARLERAAPQHGSRQVERARRAVLPKNAHLMLLGQLRKWIAPLHPRRPARTLWSAYARTSSYDAAGQEAKRSFVGEFVRAIAPAVLWDLGCNTGDYAALALENGADCVVGLDADLGALESAFERAVRGRMRLLPLYQDAFNPSPDQGWSQAERRGLAARRNADAVLALAFLHHLAIGKNVPLPQAVRWITGLAPAGVLEFVPKTDPMIQQMLALREDIFDDYSSDAFERSLRGQARILKSQQVSASGRRLYWFERP